MAQRKVEPVEDTVEDAPAPSQTQNGHPAPSSIPEAQQSPPASAPEPSATTSRIRNSVLEKVVAQHDQRIAELERKVEKKKETLRLLSSPSSFIPPPARGVVTPHTPPSTVPPGSAAPASPAVQPPPNQPNPLSAAATATQPQQHQSQPLAHNPVMAATMAAMTAASTPAVSAALHPPYSFFPYPHPDNPVMASPFMGVVSNVPPHPPVPPVQPPASSTPSQPTQASEDGGNRQSRYWTPDEHQRFLAGVNMYGAKNYQQIAEVVGTRSSRQVRTHSQKYQKKLQREEARRRGDGRTPSDINSPAQTVAAAAPATRDGTPGPRENQLRQNGSGLGGPATSSSKSLRLNEAPQSAKSAEGSSSANNAPSDRKVENSSDSVYANAEAAAAAAVLAEAEALGRGRFPPGAITMLNKIHIANSANSGLQNQAIRPREAKNAKPNGSHVPPTPNGAKPSNPGKPTENQNRTTSLAVIRPPSCTTASVPRPEAKVATTIPAGRGAESHQVAEQTLRQKLHDSGETIAPSRRPSHYSANGTVVRSPLSPDNKLVPKLAQSPVKIEPRIVPSEANGGQVSTPCHASATTAHSGLATLQSRKPPKPEMKTVNTKNSKHIAEQEVQKSAAENKKAHKETKVGSNETDTFKKEVPVRADRTTEILSNRKHEAQTLSKKGPQVASVVPNMIDTHTSPLPTASKHTAQNTSRLSTKLDAAVHICTPCEASGNGEILDKSQPITPPRMKIAEQPKLPTPVEHNDNMLLDRETPNSSDCIRGSAGKEALAIQEGKEPGVQPNASKSAAADGIRQEGKAGCEQEGDTALSKGQGMHGSSAKKPNGQGVAREVADFRNLKKPESVKPGDGHLNQGQCCKSDTAPDREKVVTKKGNRPDDMVGDMGQAVGGDQKMVVADTQLRKECSNPVSLPRAGANGSEAVNTPLRGSCSSRNEAKGPLHFENVEDEIDAKVGRDGSAQDGAHRGRCEEDKFVEEKIKKVEQMDKTEESTGGGREKSGCMKEIKKGYMKRALESGRESVAKRQKRGNESGKIDREGNGWGNAVNEAEKT